MSTTNDIPPNLTLINAAGLADPTGLSIAPASILISRPESQHPNHGPTPGQRVLAVGTPEKVRSHPAAKTATQVDLPASILLPGLVNAHSHLDLTHIGPQEFDPAEGFTAWLARISPARYRDPDDLRRSTQKGIELSLRAGVVAVGDISGAVDSTPQLAPLEALQESELLGVGFIEFFAIGNLDDSGKGGITRAVRTYECARSGPVCALPGVSRAAVGISPHAPYSVSSGAYRHAIELAAECNYTLPICTHLAESITEREFVAHCTGPKRDLLETRNIWTDNIANDLGAGLHPIDHMAEHFRYARDLGVKVLCAHVNDCPTDEHIEVLASTAVDVVYCPRASAYFGAARTLGVHRYREMLAAGVNVCLGTDSIINLVPPRELPGSDPLGSAGMGVLDEMRFLFRRDGVDAGMLLGMGTVRGARALGMSECWFGLGEGDEPLGLLAVEVSEETQDLSPMERVLISDEPPRFV